jgi:hypothetical protein
MAYLQGRGDVETGLAMRPPEKRRQNLAVAYSGALSLVRFQGKNRRIAAISRDARMPQEDFEPSVGCVQYGLAVSESNWTFVSVCWLSVKWRSGVLR